MIILSKKINAKIDSDKVDNNRAYIMRVDNIRLDIMIKFIDKLENINGLKNISRSVNNIKLRVSKNIKINIITNKFRIVILYNFYLNIAILLKLIIY